MRLPDVEGIATAFAELSAEKEKYLYRSIIRRRLLEQAIDLLVRQGEPVEGSECSQYLCARSTASFALPGAARSDPREDAETLAERQRDKGSGRERGMIMAAVTRNEVQGTRKDSLSSSRDDRPLTMSIDTAGRLPKGPQPPGLYVGMHVRKKAEDKFVYRVIGWHGIPMLDGMAVARIFANLQPGEKATAIPQGITLFCCANLKGDPQYTYVFRSDEVEKMTEVA